MDRGNPLDEPDIPLYKLPGPRLAMILVGLFFFSLFIGGFYWESYIFPTLSGSWEVSTPGKYFVMAAFLLFSMVAIGVATPLFRYKRFLTYSVYAGLILYGIGTFVLF
jgi:hypothetical protein